MITCQESRESWCLLEARNVGLNQQHGQIPSYPFPSNCPLVLLPGIPIWANGTLDNPSQKLRWIILNFFFFFLNPNIYLEIETYRFHFLNTSVIFPVSQAFNGLRFLLFIHTPLSSQSALSTPLVLLCHSF